MLFAAAVPVVLLLLAHANDTAKLHGKKGDDPEVNDSDDAEETSPWQPRTPPLTLLRLLGIRPTLDSDPSQRRPPSAPIIPGLIPPTNLGKNNRSASSSSFFAGFSHPEVAVRPLLPEVHGRQKLGNGESRRVLLRAKSNLSDDVVDGKPEVYVGDGLRLPQLHITPGGKQRWLSRDRDVTVSATVAVGDVTDTTKTGNTTDGDLSIVSRASLSITLPTSLSNDTSNTTAAPEVGASSKNAVRSDDDYDEQPEDEPDDSEIDGGDPFHAGQRKHVPVWPAPRHHMTLYPPEQRPVGLPSFDRFPAQHPIYGVHVPQTVDVPSLNGQAPGSWNGLYGAASRSDTTELPVPGPANQAATDTRTSWHDEVERDETFEEPTKQQKSGLYVEEEPTTLTTRSQSSTTSADNTGDTSLLSENDAELLSTSDHPSRADTSTTSSSAPVKSTLGGITGRNRNAIWGAASWRRSAGIASSTTSFNLLVAMALAPIVVRCTI